MQFADRLLGMGAAHLIVFGLGDVRQVAPSGAGVNAP